MTSSSDEFIFTTEQGTAHAIRMSEIEPETVEPDYINLEFLRITSNLGRVSLPDTPAEVPEPPVRVQPRDKSFVKGRTLNPKTKDRK